MMFVKGLIVYGWGLIVTFILFVCILHKLYQLSTYACCLTFLQIVLLAWVVVDAVLEIKNNSKKKKSTTLE